MIRIIAGMAARFKDEREAAYRAQTDSRLTARIGEANRGVYTTP